MKKILAIFITLVLILGEFSGCSLSEKKAAISAYNTALEKATAKNDELVSIISNSEELINADEPVYDADTLLSFKSAVADAKDALVELPTEMPKNVEDIKGITDETLNKVDYTDLIEKLTNAKSDYEYSVKQMKQVNCPDESFVIERLKKVEGIMEIAPATEDNDPNGNLGKQGGYTAQIYFSYEAINQSEISGSDVIEKGTDCGGSIEIYRTVDDVEQRDDYLANFDGTALASGSHTICGTILVRTSDYLKASQQQELEKAIIDALLAINE
ncbi:MAG: hypothetical protein K6F14_00935 [Clostridiales bacterium]|nr:hypothetical protein [Clostridiales bacterium]